MTAAARPSRPGAGADDRRAALAGRLSRQGHVAALDRLTALAARLLGAGSCQVSLISDEQLVASGTGTAAAGVGMVSPAADSLCTITVAAAASVLVDDAQRDPRTQALPPVASGTVGSYLGVPLETGGHVVGSLCVFEPGPRAWTAEETATLEALAPAVVAELELAQLETEHRDQRVVWQLAVDAGGVGAFDWDLVTGELRWDERLLELFGLDPAGFGGTIEAFNAAVHPDDLESVTAALTHAVETCGAFVSQYRVVLPDRAVRWISARGQALAGPDGATVRLLGAASDTTDAVEHEARLTRVLESVPTAFYHLDTAWRFTYVNAQAEQLLGRTADELVGGVVWDLFPATRDSEFETGYRHAVESRGPVTFDAHYPAPLDGWYEVRAWPMPDGLSVYFIEVSERHAAQLAMSRAARRSAWLNQVTQTLTGTLEPEVAVAELSRLVVPELGQWCIVTLADAASLEAEESGDWRRGLRDVACWHHDEDARATLQSYTDLRLEALTDGSHVAQVLRGHGGALVATDAATAAGGAVVDGEASRLLEALHPASAAVVSMRGRDRVVGLLTVFRDDPRDPFTGDDVAALEDAAGRAGLALDNARLYTEQLRLAEHLQRSMMTEPPEPDHLHVAVRYVPAAEAAQVGGDWYDAFLQPGGATVLVIGDVVGHDTAAAAAMGQVRSILRGVAVATGTAPAELLTQVDGALDSLRLSTTATAVVARLEQTPQERVEGLTRLRWSNAGHPPPMLVEAGPGGTPRAAEVLWGDRANLLLGYDPQATRTDQIRTVRRGSTILFYTDGLVERRGQGLDEGIGDLATTFASLVHDGVPLEELCDEVLRRMLPERPDDDVALVAVRLHPEDRPLPAEVAVARAQHLDGRPDL